MKSHLIKFEMRNTFRPRWNSLVHFFIFCIALMILRVPPTLGQTVVGTISRPGLRPWSLAFYEAGNKLFVGDRATGNLLIYDGSSMALLAELSIDGGAGGSSMVIDEPSGKLYLSTFPGGYHVAVINAITNQLIRYINVDTYGLEKDEGLRRVYAIGRLSRDLYVVDVPTDGVGSVPLSHAGLTSGLGVNPITHEVFIGYLQGNSLDIVDGTTLTRTTVPGINGWGIVVNWLQNKVYGELGGYGGFWVHDRANGSTSTIRTIDDRNQGGNDGNPQLFNPVSNRIYGTSEVNQSSTIITCASDAYFNLPMKTSFPLGVCLSTNHVYYVGQKFIGVLDDSTQFLEIIPINNPAPSSGVVWAVAVDQIRGRVYVVNDGDALNFITVIQDTEVMIRPPVYAGSTTGFEINILDPLSKTLVDTWYPAYPGQCMTVRPGFSDVYVASSLNESLSIYAGCGSRPLLACFETGGNDPAVPAVTFDGTRIYVTNSATNNVSVINTADNSVVTLIPVGKTPWGAAVTTDGSKVFVANKSDNSISVISTTSNTVTKTIPVGIGPWGVAVNPSGTKAYVANSGSGTVSVIDINTETVIATVAVGSTPHWLTVTPDGKYVYVSNTGSNTLSVIDTGTDEVIHTIAVSANPEGIAALPDGSEIYVGTETAITVINASDYSLNVIPVPPRPGLSTKIVPIAIADPTSRFAGRVTSGSVPLSGCTIRAIQSGLEKGRATSNAAGDYSIFNLKYGTYDIEVSADEHFPQSLPNQSVGRGQTTVSHFKMIPFAPSPPSLLSPNDGALDQPTVQTLRWQPVPRAETYRLQVTTDSSFTTVILDDSTITSTSRQVGPLANSTTYYWHVKSKNTGGTSDWSSVWHFTTIIARPTAPTLDSPANGTTGASTSPTLSWNASSGAISYRLQVSTSSSFSITVFDQSGITGTSQAVTGLLNNAMYYWRVNATNAGGTSAWSEIWSFTTILQLPDQVLLLYPSNSVTINADSAEFIWRRSKPDVIRYWFEISADSQLTNPDIDTTLVDTSKIVHSLENNKTYWWRVKAKNAAGWSPFSNKWKFSTLISSVPTSKELPREFGIYQNYPNPFNPLTTIEYHLPKDTYVTLRIFNIRGELVKTLKDERQSVGYYKIQWDGSDENGNPVSAGLYLYHLKADGFVQLKKMVLIR